ncbi:MAG: hypothetical protein KGQ54_04630 [Verrucomicrobia bacterium]|nr:hypothetical protein [Verrucomicrobiota bacterium]NDE62884.1 hypothetical protein [Chlamydiota bacterium]
MKSIEQFSFEFETSDIKVVRLFYKGDYRQDFFGEDAIFQAVGYMNQELKNFRLDGTIIFCNHEPSLKEMGLLHLSRVEKVCYLKPIEESLNKDWDAFKVHKVERELYVAQSNFNRDA